MTFAFAVSKRMTRALGAAALGIALGLGLAAPLTPARAEVSDAQRKDIEAVIKDYLLKHPEVLRDALVELERRGKVEEAEKRAKAVSDLAPQIFRSKHQVVLGNPDGKIELVEFFDYNCGFCKKALGDLATIIEKNPDVRVVLKEFPVLGPGSVEAAQVASALHKQFDAKKYWDFHQKLLGARGQVNKQLALAAAKAAGADMSRLDVDMASGDIRTGLQEVMQIADALGLTGTPSWVVGNEVVIGAVGLDALQGKIDNVRKCGKADCG